MGIERPRVALLSAVETVNPRMRSTLDAAALCKMAERGQITGGLLDGPLAFDNAVSPEAAAEKGIVSEVAGQADILLVPDLEAGNMLAKQLIFLAGADAAGVVLGARVPIILASRADAERTRMASCAVAVLIARRQAAGLQTTEASLSHGRRHPYPQCRFIEHQVLTLRSGRFRSSKACVRRRSRGDWLRAAFHRARSGRRSPGGTALA